MRTPTERATFTASLLLVTLVALVAAGSPTATASEPMTRREAGKFYLAKACQVNAAADRFYERLWKGRKLVTREEERRRLPEFKYEAEKYGKAEIRFGTRLKNPPAPWPTSVGGLPEKLANSDLKYGALLRRAGAADSAASWSYWYRKSQKVEFGNLAVRIRAELNLPPSGEGCS